MQFTDEEAGLREAGHLAPHHTADEQAAALVESWSQLSPGGSTSQPASRTSGYIRSRRGPSLAPLLLAACRGSWGWPLSAWDVFFHDVWVLTQVTSRYPGAFHREGYIPLIRVNRHMPPDPSIVALTTPRETQETAIRTGREGPLISLP